VSILSALGYVHLLLALAGLLLFWLIIRWAEFYTKLSLESGNCEHDHCPLYGQRHLHPEDGQRGENYVVPNEYHPLLPMLDGKATL